MSKKNKNSLNKWLKGKIKIFNIKDPKKNMLDNHVKSPWWGDSFWIDIKEDVWWYVDVLDDGTAITYSPDPNKKVKQ